MKKRVGIFALLFILVIFLFLFSSCSKNQTKDYPDINQINSERKETKQIKIGFLGDLNDEKLGKAALHGVELAVEEINSNSNNTKINLIVYDSQNNLGSVEDFYKKLVNEDGVMAIISAQLGSENIAEKLQVPTIIIGPDRYKAEKSEQYYFGLEFSYVTYNAVMQGIKRLRRETNISSATIVTDNAESTSGYNSALQEVLSTLKISLLDYQILNQDITALISKIKGLSPDLVIISTNSDNTIKFLKEAKLQNLNPKIFLAGPQTNEEAITNNHGDLPQIVYVQSSIISPSATLGGIETFRFFIEKIRQKTGTADINTASLNAYDATKFIYWILNKRIELSNTPENLQKDRQEIIKAVWDTRFYRTTIGTLVPNARTGFLSRNFHGTIMVKDGQASLLPP